MMPPREWSKRIYRPTYIPLSNGGRIYQNKIAMFVIRVRMKPPGAPARYSSEHDRRNWEQYPEEMRKCPF